MMPRNLPPDIAGPLQPPRDAVTDPEAMAGLMQERQTMRGPSGPPNPGMGMSPMQMSYMPDEWATSMDIPRAQDSNPFKDPMGEQKHLSYNPQAKRGFRPDSGAAALNPQDEAIRDAILQQAAQQRDKAVAMTEQTLNQNAQRQLEAERYI